MTLTGRAAEEHPEINDLKSVRYGLVTHAARINGAGGRAWVTAGPGRTGFGRPAGGWRESGRWWDR